MEGWVGAIVTLIFLNYNEPHRCPGGESVEDMQIRVDTVIAKVDLFLKYQRYITVMVHVQVRETHRKYLEDGVGARDVVIVAHGHFNRVFISRWVGFPLALGKSNVLCHHQMSPDRFGK